jgi:uncharacterized membrane protein YgdD (TMEM256/DUF423 family)
MSFVLCAGALLAGLGVAAGAFGAHALKSRLGAYELGVFETAVRYQMYHALALVAIGARSLGFSVRGPAILFVIGVALFSGSLYVLALTGVRWLGAITPFGGLAFLAGWAWLVAAAWRA